jgi:hypothetical protein
MGHNMIDRTHVIIVMTHLVAFSVDRAISAIRGHGLRGGPLYNHARRSRKVLESIPYFQVQVTI